MAINEEIPDGRSGGEATAAPQSDEVKAREAAWQARVDEEALEAQLEKDRMLSRQSARFTEMEKEEELRRAVEEREAEHQMRAKVFQAESRIAVLEAYMRAGLAALLVAGLLFAVLFSVLKDVNPSDVAQYLAPISGLAGLAVGYFFGRGSSRGTESSRSD